MVFFFKQKSADEMRISDWSSDVCSSDLSAVTDHLWAHLLSDRKGTGFCLTTQPALPHGDGRMRYGETFGRWIPSEKIAHHNSTSFATASSFQRPRTLDHRGAKHETIRSEEHTSELQSLMRISYAVFCLKKK